MQKSNRFCIKIIKHYAENFYTNIADCRFRFNGGK